MSEPQEQPTVDLLLRKSKVVREGEHSLSIRAQEQRGRRWAAEHGYEVREVFAENLSAWSDTRRPQQEKALRALLDGDSDCLWAYAMDRWSRRGADSVTPVLGRARLIFDYEGLDSSREHDRRRILDSAEEARAFSIRLSSNVRSTKAQQRSEGRWLGQAPYGLEVSDDRRLRPGDCWHIVLRIFRDIAEGISGRQLAIALNAEGIASMRGAGWTSHSVLKIVHHPVYQGWLTVSPSGVAARWVSESGQHVTCWESAALAQAVPEDLARNAQRVASGHQRPTGSTGRGRAKHDLSSFVYCAGCDTRMVLSGRSYGCQRVNSGRLCEAPASVLRVPLETYAGEAVIARLGSAEAGDEWAAAVGARWSAARVPGATGAAESARAELRAAEAALGRVHRDIRADLYEGPSARYREPAVRQANARVEAAQAALAEAEPDVINIDWMLDSEYFSGWWAGAPSADRREVYGATLDRITVHKGRRGEHFDPDRAMDDTGKVRRVMIRWVGED